MLLIPVYNNKKPLEGHMPHLQSIHQTLKARQRNERQHHPQSLALRVHRSLSWLERAAKETDDLDNRFILLWIAFNAAYAFEIDDHQRFTEQQTFKNFLERICSLDTQKQLENLVWQEFTSSIRILLKNQFVFQPFWDFHNHKISEEDWKNKFVEANKVATKAIGFKNTEMTLSVIFSRLYTVH